MRPIQLLSAALLAYADLAVGQYYSTGYRSYGSGGLYGLGVGGALYGARYVTGPAVTSYSAGYAPQAIGYTTSYGGGVPSSVSYSTRAVGLSPASVAYTTGGASAAVPVATTTAVRAVPVVATGGGSLGGAALGFGAVRPASASIAYSTGVSGGIGAGGAGGLAAGGAGGGALVTAAGGAGGVANVRTHEIHTGGAGSQILVEEYRAGGQLIRVHDAPRAQTEVLDVEAPAPAAQHVRLVSRGGGTQVQRTVHQDPTVQVFDIQNPVQPGDRVINIRRQPAPPAHVELVAEAVGAPAEVVVGDDDQPNVRVEHVGGASGALVGAGGAALAAAPAAGLAGGAVRTTFASVPVAVGGGGGVQTTYSAAPAITTNVVRSTYSTLGGAAVAPAQGYLVSAGVPAVQTIGVSAPLATRTVQVASAPAFGVGVGPSYAVSATPALGSYTTRINSVQSTPVLSYTSGTTLPALGGLSSSYGYSSGSGTLGTTAILHKKAAKKAAAAAA